MTQLVIRGHATRGKEVIEILEMLGGKSYTVYAYKGEDPNRCYCINKYSNFIDSPLVLKDDVQVFSLEEFLVKYPYKVGDKVAHSDYESPLEIVGMKWENNSIKYEVYTDDYGCWFSVDALQPYKEETTEENKIFNEILDTLSSYLIDFMTPQGIDKCIKYIRENMDEYNKEETAKEIKVNIPKGYEFAGVDDDNQQVVFTKIQPKYPKTYKECCKIMKIHPSYELFGKATTQGEIITDCVYEQNLLRKINKFHKLLICRDAYWKIAGEQMGLGKPWEPKWEIDNVKYSIIVVENEIRIGDNEEIHRLLVFPTEEMRDTFLENFKELIESCKELL